MPETTPEPHWHFCTYFDRNYLTRGIALYRSLGQHCRRPFTLWTLCFDDESYATLKRLALPGLQPIRRQDFEASDTELAEARKDRTEVEYYWTCTPSLPLYLLKQHPHIDLITYLDADLYFFSDPTPIFAELGDGSIMIHGHRYPHELAYLADEVGIYNVGMLAFRRDANGLACLRWWRVQCNAWCHARVENGHFGDQKYLDDWPSRFAGVVVLEHAGAGVAPWNLSRYQLTADSIPPEVDGLPVIFFHFHALRIQSNQLAYLVSAQYSLDLSAIDSVFRPYIDALDQAAREIGTRASDGGTATTPFRLFAAFFYQEVYLRKPQFLSRLLWMIGGRNRHARNCLAESTANFSHLSAKYRWRVLTKALRISPLIVANRRFRRFVFPQRRNRTGRRPT